MESSYAQSILVAIAVGLASGSIGTFVILRRMALVGDALSHVALPGIGLALFYSVDPFWGVLGFLVGAAVLVWWLEIKTKLPTDALVGLLFTASLAVGILTIPDTELVESLFGEFPSLSPAALMAVLLAAIAAAAFSFLFAKRFLFLTVLPDLAKSSGLGMHYNLILLLLFSVVVALGIKLIGTLLMGALTIIPASIARNISHSMTGYMLVSTFFGGFIAAVGVLAASTFGFLPGPTIILLGVMLFLGSLVSVRK